MGFNIAEISTGRKPIEVRIVNDDISFVEKMTEYGIRFVVDQKSSVGERFKKLGGTILRGEATGLQYNVGTNDGLNVLNSFDHIPCFASERVIIGSNHFMKFYAHYAKLEFITENGTNYFDLSFSLTKHKGYHVPDVFKNWDGSMKPYIYVGVYGASLGEDNKLKSLPGVMPKVSRSAADFLTDARLNDGLGTNSAYLIRDLMETSWWNMRQKIRMGTRNAQAYLLGVSSLPYDTAHKTIGNQNQTNVLVLSNAHAGGFVIGQSIGDVVSPYRRVVNIEVDVPEIGQTTITFDGDPADIPEGSYVRSRAWLTGMTDSIVASDGYYEANNGKYPIKIDGIENPYGDTYDNIAGIKIKGDEIWICNDTRKYNWVANTDDYIKLSYKVPQNNGYIKEMGFDSMFPMIRLPIVVSGGSNATYYADYFYQGYVEDIFRTVYCGGHWYYGGDAGPFCWYVAYGLGNTSFTCGARLSYRP